ncbi:homoserine dehydrogenase-domain-containing protein [Geopyxis carbonaria]|nr:homoserine dehydrogenase-domain-containing protein [Geopyxis carbonaria]
MSTIHVAVIGVGGVGKAFIAQLAGYAARNQSKKISTILISRSSKALISKDYAPLNLSQWADDLSSSETKPLSFPDQTLSFLESAPGPVILVDNTSDESLASSYPAFLSKGIHIVTPNKKGFSSNISLWKDIYAASTNGGNAKAGYIFHEATVGAGLPVLSTLKELVETGDKVKKIEGIFSGTMSFLFNSFAPLSGNNGGKGFAACVKEARDLGYTEPDPRDDLNGLDVARKLTILARLSGLEVESPTSFPIQSLIPGPLESAKSAEEFLDGLSGFDGDMTKLKEEAEAKGSVIRYIGSLNVETKDVKVGLETFDKGSTIAGLQGSDNIISFYTERYGNNPLIIQGAGAGADVTAMGVLGDLIKVVQRL